MAQEIVEPSWLCKLLCGRSITIDGVILEGEGYDFMVRAHEMEHARQEAAHGWWTWAWDYVFHREFRARMERGAFVAEMQTIAPGFWEPYLNAFAADLAGPAYWHAEPSVEAAKAALWADLGGKPTE